MGNKKKSQFPLLFLIITWGVVLALAVTILCVGELTELAIKPSTYYLITIIVSFASFVATSFFGISVYNHNTSVRDQNNEIRHQTNAVNRRSEAFRNLQFIASNYTIVDFVDYMLLFPESKRYIDKLEKNKSLQFYLTADNINPNDIIGNLDNYTFLTARLPMMIVEGRKMISRIKIKRFKFETDDAAYRFISPLVGDYPDALILFNEADSRNEAVINLIMKKDSEFYTIGDVNQYIKIQIQLEMESLLGVTVTGQVELYFTNPHTAEDGGGNRYKINSSQFTVVGMPRLTIDKEFNPD